MEIILLVIALLLIGTSKNIGDKNELRFIVGIILGITYFFIWPYLYYILHLLSWSEIATTSAYVALITLTMLVIRPLLAFKSYGITLLMCIFCAVVFWAISYNYDIEIKDKLAEQANYFNTQLTSIEKIANFDRKEITSPTKAYTVTIPAQWKVYKHKSTGLPYYKTSENDESTIEFRPKCYDTRLLNITEIVEGTTSVRGENDSASQQCYLWRNNGYACKITISDNTTGVNRIRWLGASKDTKRMLELDFIIKNSNEHDLKIIDSIFESVRFNKQATPTGESCAYSIEWF